MINPAIAELFKAAQITNVEITQDAEYVGIAPIGSPDDWPVWLIARTVQEGSTRKTRLAQEVAWTARATADYK